jgi:hypothetical protein
MNPSLAKAASMAFMSEQTLRRQRTPTANLYVTK